MTRPRNDDSGFWHIWVDTGGTFTDCLAIAPDGQWRRTKVLSSSALRGVVTEALSATRLRVQTAWQAPDDFITGCTFHLLRAPQAGTRIRRYDAGQQTIELEQPLDAEVQPNEAFEVRSPEAAPILAARLVTQTPFAQPLPPLAMRLATTRGTNALLERKGARVALFMTQGFGDLLLIGTQQRPDLFALDIRKPPPFYETVVEVPERLDAQGQVLRPLQLDAVAERAQALLKSGIDVAAVALMHSYVNPEHEQRLAERLKRLGFRHITCSHEVAPFIKLLERAETAVVDAYLAPIIRNYLQQVREPIGSGRLHVMTSAGGLVQPDEFRAKDSLLSGPAGGVVGAARVGRQSGFEKVIAFDMGGTSTDVSRYDGDFEYVFEQQLGDAHLVAPALAIESVAAGGGSICWFDGARLRVGPQSAGASPGPACYGAGGPLTLTDINLLLGRLDPARFGIPISIEKAGSAFDAIAAEIASAGRSADTSRETLLQGFLDIANERMADAIRRISTRKGYDPAEYALVSFGGAGGQHACAVARLLGIRTVIVPQDASLLSAFGLGHAVIERFAEKQVLQPLADIRERLGEWIAALADEARQRVIAEGVAAGEVVLRRTLVHVRFVGQDFSLAVDYDPDTPLETAFEQAYRTIYGHWPEGRPLEIESIRVIASTRPPELTPAHERLESYQPGPGGTFRTFIENRWQDIPWFDRPHLRPGARFSGPALIFEKHSTTFIEPGWQAEVDGYQAVILKWE